MTMGKILITGAKGQLGKTLLPYLSESNLPEKYSVVLSDRDKLNLSRHDSISSFLSSCKPSVIINCAAYTAVDKAEIEFEFAKKINDEAVGHIAGWASKNGCRLIQISTDFVFDGSKGKPYTPGDLATPIGVYGRTKQAGEKHVLEILNGSGVIVRTSWLYSEHRQNFVKKMIRLMSEKPELGVVNDQLGSPTSAHTLAKLLIKLIENQSFCGIFHWCDGASITWYDFAVEIQEAALAQGLLKKRIPLSPLRSADFPTRVTRPLYSVLDRSYTLEKFAIIGTDWRMELGEVIKRISEKTED